MLENIGVQDFNIFKEALSEENLELQILIVQKLDSLAKSLGETSTREELLPFLEYHYIEFHDEILFNLAEKLKHLIPLVGGLEHSKIILDILGKLCFTDENIVRERAVKTIISIQDDLSTQQVEEFILPVVDRLAKDDWFTGKCSAVTMFSSLYPKLSEKGKMEMRNTFKTLIQDDSPMVRRAAATACADFVAVVEDDLLKSEFVPIFQDIAQDPMDSVRAMTTDIALALLERLGQDNIDESVIKTIEAAGDDASWRIRQRLANSIPAFQQQIPHGKYRGKFLALFQKLSQDMESEVRVFAATNLFSYCKFLRDSYLSQPLSENNFEPVFEQSLMSIVRRLIDDENEDVRLALSSNILPLSTILSEECFKKNIISLVLHVLINEESIAVQSNFILGLSGLSTNIDLTQSLDAMKNTVRAIIVRSHMNWRTRRSILMTLIDIANFCNADYFSTHFKIYYAALLGDAVFAVRRCASLILPIISKRYGIKWASEHLVPYFTMFTRDTRYLYRFVSLFGISEMINPRLCSQPQSYLNDFKELVAEKKSSDHKSVIALVKIVKTSHLVQKELEDEKYTSILKLKDDLDYISNYDVNIYAENDFDKLKEKYGNVNVYSVEAKDLDKDCWPYLQGILGLIYNTFLPIIDTLNRDATENIQIRAVCTLAEISDFITKITKEESEPWVQDCLKLLTQEEIAAVNEEIHREFKTAKFEDDDLIDTNLIDASDEPDLSKTICIERSFAVENLNVARNSDSNIRSPKESDVTDRKKSEEPVLVNVTGIDDKTKLNESDSNQSTSPSII